MKTSSLVGFWKGIGIDVWRWRYAVTFCILWGWGNSPIPEMRNIHSLNCLKIDIHNIYFLITYFLFVTLNKYRTHTNFGRKKSILLIFNKHHFIFPSFSKFLLILLKNQCFYTEKKAKDQYSSIKHISIHIGYW